MDSLLGESLAVWWDVPGTPPRIGRTFTPAEQNAREAALDRFLGAIQKETSRPPLSKRDRKSAHQRITAAFCDFARLAADLEDRHLELLIGPDGLSNVGTDLARQARRLDPAVPAGDIFQACRNAWTACGIQRLLGRSLRLSPAVFAYSMLYPYTDNYLDDPGAVREAKAAFSGRFRDRLAGGEPSPANSREATIWRLVGVIESEYPRAAHPGVFESLLRIHAAQQNSIRLLSALPPETSEIERLVFEKGGSSVLADGYLAAGDLTPDQARFVFNWGIFLQLADDLQDIGEDRRGGVRTLFSHAAGNQPLDELTSRTLHFGQRAMLLMHQLPETDAAALRELIQASSMSLVVRSAGAAGEFHSAGFIRTLEAHSPFRFAYLDDRKRQLEKRGGMLTRLFEAFLAGDEDEPAFPWFPSSLMPSF